MAAKSRDLLIDVLGLAALSVNGWFSRRAAALRMMRTRRFSCCERAQREIAMAVMGSLQTFAAQCISDRYADKALVHITLTNQADLGHSLASAMSVVHASCWDKKTLPFSPSTI